MGKISSRNNLQKIHTFAQDIEAVRGAKQSNIKPSPTNENSTKSSAKTTKKKFTPTPTIKKTDTKKPNEENTDLLIPQKPKLPAIRTMADDSKNASSSTLDSTKDKANPAKEKETRSQPSIEDKPVTEKEESKYTKAPTVLTPSVNKNETKKTAAEARTFSVTSPSTKITEAKSQPTPKPQKITVAKNTVAPVDNTNKQTRDSTYKATVITDTKHKRFSLWREIKKKINDLVKSKTAKKKVSYTTETAPLRKGVIQSATTNTARKTIADYSSLKDRVKARPENERESPNDSSSTESDELQKTRSELLNTIEREVSEDNKGLPEYLSPITQTKSSPDTPVFNQVKDASITKKVETPSAWDHYASSDTEDTLNSSTEEISPTETTTPTPKILPTIPSPPAKIPDIDMTIPAETPPTEFAQEPISDFTNTPTETYTSPQTEVEQDAFLTPTQETIDEPLTQETATSVYESNQPPVGETSITPEPYFTQPVIEPVVPFELSTNVNTEQPSVRSDAQYPTVPEPPATVATRAVELEQQMTPNPTKQATNIPTQSLPKKKSRIVSFITERTQTFIFGGLTVASVIIVGGIAITSLISQFNGTSIANSHHRYFNSSAVYPVVVSPLSTLTITEQISRHNNAIGVSELILQSNTEVVVSPTILSQLLKLPLEPTFNASLLDIRFGWYREQPFVVIRYSGDSIARGALLQWERSMYTDLLPLFSKTPVSSSLTTIFKDATVNNIDVRALYLATGEEVLMYGIVAPGHLIITTNEMSFLNLSTNFNAQ